MVEKKKYDFQDRKYEFEIEGVKCSFSTNFVARKSQSAVLARMGDTVVLATANTGRPMADADFFPLSVEYLEKMYAAGKISGSRFVKRERFPTDDAILKARMIDRSIRSRFPSDYRNEVQVIVKVLSFDPEHDPFVLGLNAASAALMLSRAPFSEPVSGVRVGMEGESFVALNRHMDRDNSSEFPMSLIVAGDGESFTNIDGGSKETPEDKVIDAMAYGLELMQPWLEAQKEFVKIAGEIEKDEYESFAIAEDLKEKLSAEFGDEIAGNVLTHNRNIVKDATVEEASEKFSGEFSKKAIAEAYEYLAKKEVRRLALEDGQRVDGRAFDEIRPLDIHVGLLPKVHGSGLFTRGLTQVLTIATLGSTRSQMTVDDMTGEDERRFMHYYLDAPYCFGEAGRFRHVPGRREVGHGALAEKALSPVLPTMEEFPYTILLMSEIMSEEGSSSMASTCGSTLALMDAGVPITRPVAGIALGVVLDEEKPENYKILSDIQGLEDFYGFMDFKVTGTTEGVTAIQMDTKSPGLSLDIFREAIKQSREGRLELLKQMTEVISEPRVDVSDNAPKVDSVKIPVNKIGELIGPGGKNIKAITEETGAELDINDDGTVNVFAETKDSMEEAMAIVADYAFVAEVGEVYDGVVVKIMDFGAFVDIARGVSGLVHVSELADDFVKDVNEFVKEGQEVKVKCIGIDDQGKIKLSMKALNGAKPAPKSEGSDKPEAPTVERKGE